MTPALARARRVLRRFNAVRFPGVHASARADADFAAACGVPRMRDLRMALEFRRALRAVA